MKLTAVITPEEDMFVALCPELDIVSQGYSRDEAHANLKEAVEGFLEVASPTEIQQCLAASQGAVSELEVAFAQAA